jgi:hypothetical protein
MTNGRKITALVTDRFKAMTRAQQRDLLANVCQNMLDNEDWETIGTLLVVQLGPADALECVNGR